MQRAPVLVMIDSQRLDQGIELLPRRDDIPCPEPTLDRARCQLYARPPSPSARCDEVKDLRSLPVPSSHTSTGARLPQGWARPQGHPWAHYAPIPPSRSPGSIGRLGPTQPDSVRPCSSPPHSARKISSGAASAGISSTEGVLAASAHLDVVPLHGISVQIGDNDAGSVRPGDLGNLSDAQLWRAG